MKRKILFILLMIIAICFVGCSAPSPTPVDSITLSATSISMEVGENHTLTATINPADATDKTVTWTTSNPEVATVTSGVVVGISAGTTTIIATTTNGKVAVCTVIITAQTPEEPNEPEEPQIDEYAVTFDTNGGSEVASQTVENGEKAVKPENPTKEGYDFVGWFVDDEEWSFIGYVITENTTLTAKWQPTTYNITYNLDGGSVSGNNTYTIESDIYELPIPNKSYCEFLGWYDNANFDGEAITQIEKGSIGNKEFYAKWNYLGLKYTKNENSYTVSDADTSATQITIPSTYQGLPVTSIGSSAFYNCTPLTSVEIPDSVTTIGEYAFYCCTSLTSVEFGENCQLTSIGERAFYACTKLTNIEIPDSVTSIGASAFYNCYSLTIYCEVASEPSGWDSNWNYSRCPVVWDYKNNEVANDGYIYTIINRIRYALKDNVATVVRQPSNITTANILSTVTYKGNTYNVTSIGEWAFWNCTSLTSVEIPDSVTSIGDKAFYYCDSLRSIEIPDSVTSIGDEAFSICSSLTIYCEVASKPNGWSIYWNYYNRPVYWAGEWEYVNGVPTPKN